MSAPLSLKCDQCGTQLRSVAEAQEHGEVTGHSQFSESTEAVLNMTCTDCGKPCRSQTECDLHTQRTGHKDFVDKTNEAATINTEKQMKEARNAEMPDAAPKEEEMVQPEVNADLMQQLKDMGFPENRVTRALHFTGTENVETAITWIVEHEADADIDDPLFVPKSSIKPALSPEEAKRKLEEMVAVARKKKEAEEKEREKERERQRIEMGKQMALARKAEEEQALRRNAQVRQAEKEEEKRAMAAIKAKIEEDRKERRRKLGLPEKLTEEEKAAEAARKAAEAEKAAASRMGLPVKPVSAMDKMRKLLVDMKKADGEERAKVAWQTLLKYLGNVVKNPDEVKFRAIKLSNEAFQRRVGSATGAIEFLTVCGFQRDDAQGCLTMPRDAVDLVLLNTAGGELNSALSNPFFGVL
mmetsp:Transcript_44596/g.113972  ORF Transcript_44596/g.113972 Transcript_44596/m.113972 type:complete len:413 (-) Transcript_44596:13-1251(-)